MQTIEQQRPRAVTVMQMRGSSIADLRQRQLIAVVQHHERIDNARFKARTAIGLNQLQHIERRQRIAVRALGSQRLENIQERQDSPSQRYLRPLQALWIPQPIRALVVRGHDGGNRFELHAGLLQDALTDLDVALHLNPILRRQLAGVVENAFRNTNLAQIVQHRRPVQRLEFVRVHLQRVTHLNGVVRDALGVIGCFVIALTDQNH